MQQRSGIFGAPPSHHKSADLIGVFGSSKASGGAATILNTLFTEATSGNVTGTSPATNVHGNLWVTWPTVASLTYQVGGGAKASLATGSGNIIDTGATAYTVTFSGMTNTNGVVITFSMSSASATDRMELWTLGSGGIALKETVANTTSQLQTQPVANGATGSVVAVVNGTSITVTAFGQAPMTYTIPNGHADIGGRFVGLINTIAGAYTFGGVKVTIP